MLQTYLPILEVLGEYGPFKCDLVDTFLECTAGRLRIREPCIHILEYVRPVRNRVR